MSTPILEDAAKTLDGIIIANPKNRKIFATVGMWFAGALSAMSAGAGAAELFGAHLPTWVAPALMTGYAVYGAFATWSHGIWKANIK